MGYRLNIFLNRVQDRAVNAMVGLHCETWRLAVRHWAPRTWPFPVTAAAFLAYGQMVPGAAFAATCAAPLVFLVGAMPWLARLLARGVLAALNWRARRAIRAAYKPPRQSDGSVDWAAIESYVLLSEAAWYDTPKTLEALMAGPMERFIQLCEDDSTAIRGRARIMEFARGAPEAFKRRRARKPDAAHRVDEAVMAELERRFADHGPDGRYLIDVYLGKRTHNG